MKAVVGSLAFGVSVVMGTMSGHAASPGLAAHKAVYDLSLLSKDGSRSPNAARGRIAYSFSGDGCDGYTMSFRQVTVLQSSEGEPKVSDLRSTTFEDGDGANFKFRSEHQSGASSRIVDGSADRRDGGLAVKIERPKADRLDVRQDVLFPSAHMKRLIESAIAGQSLLSVKVYDGSDDGLKIYDTLSVIGRKIESGAERPLEEPAIRAGLDKAERWPVSVSYFTEGGGERAPAYSISFDLFENGIIAALKLDYGSFTLKGDMKQLDVLPASKCQR